MPKLMVIRIIMSLGAVLLSTAPISQTFAQAQHQAQASGIAVADTLSNSSATAGDRLQLVRRDATIIFPKGDSIPVADSAAAVPAAAISTTGKVWIGILIAAVIVGGLYLIALATCGEC